MEKVILITGGTSGIGLHAAKQLAAVGCRVYECSRRAEGAEGMIHLQADVTDDTQIERAVQDVLAREGRIDVVIIHDFSSDNSLF